ncbi:MAG: LysM peptidoglycan-binding domain-containing protein [Polyangiales bacterium]
MPRTSAPLAALGLAFATWLSAAHVDAQPLFHTIARGESLSVIASRYHVSVSALAERNHLTEANPVLRAGQRLRLPSHTVGGAPVTADPAAERPAPARAPAPSAAPERRAERTPPSRSRGAVAARPEPRGGGRWAARAAQGS